MSTMAKPGDVAQPGFWASMLHAGLYKPSQGRIVRQVTAVAIAVLMLLAAYEIGNVPFLTNWVGNVWSYEHASKIAKWLLMGGIAVGGLWMAYRIVNYPKFADFMIAVEAEMNKVSWPGKQELWRSSLVVMFVIFFMAILLFAFDVAWSTLFKFFGIRYLG